MPRDPPLMKIVFPASVAAMGVFPQCAVVERREPVPGEAARVCFRSGELQDGPETPRA
jgi:hypothetical protein